MKRNLLWPVLALPLGALAIAFSVFANSAAVPEYALYQNERFGFSLLVPADMHAQETEADGGQEILFSDPSSNKELIVTASSYSQFDVTLQREGDASNIHDQPDHLEIVNIRRDDLFRVWFIKNGVLYRIVTMPELETWLTGTILPTWQFE